MDHHALLRKARDDSMALAKKEKVHYTYHDYLTWNDGERWEIIEGEAYNMSPAPTFVHQNIAGICYRQLANQLQQKKCIPGMAPTDVVLSEDNVVQPDVFVVCQKKKIKESHIDGAPDLVIEVISPATALKDKREKRLLYEKFGVKEYILIYPEESLTEQYVLHKTTYLPSKVFGDKQTMHLASLKGVKLDLREIFKSKEIFKK